MNVIGVFLLVVVALFVVSKLMKPASYNLGPRVKAADARMPCLANKHCPMGQSCSSGFCSEGFAGSDMSSCTSKECAGVNAPCARTGNPCAEGTFCQGNSCVPISPASQGEAYNQIGMLLN